MINVYVDIGELGWSLYLYGYINWLLKNEYNQKYIAVVCLKDRQYLYNSINIATLPVPEDFHEKYSKFAQDGFGLYGVSSPELKTYFNQYFKSIDQNYRIASEFEFRCHRFFDGKLFFEPVKTKRRILVFPRYRASDHHAFRNLPLNFYERLIHKLYFTFTDYVITIVGTQNGTYNFDKWSSLSRLDNQIGKSKSIQDLIDLCAISDVAIGGTSAPPKVSLLQGVPTFIIGHEKERFLKDDNWMNTKAGFYEIENNGYKNIDVEDAVKHAVEFCKEAINGR